MKNKVNYGIDAPDVVCRLAIVGTVLIIASVCLSHSTSTNWFVQFGKHGLSKGVILLATAGLMVWGSKIEKLRMRDKIIERLRFKGHEAVLDVGCGHGLMSIGVAKTLPHGKVIGVDIWQAKDQAGNCMDATKQNVRCEGVSDRVEIQDADARSLPFADGSFDAVVSSWVVHNIVGSKERARAVNEMIRVLKPGGRLAITDIGNTWHYARVLRKAGALNVRMSWPNFLFLIPTVTVYAEKAESPLVLRQPAPILIDQPSLVS